MSGVSKIVVERNQRILLDLVAQPGNDTCADCKGNAPRWASHNLGIFLCVRCASVHRKIGTHVTKVKSLTLDSWTKEQVENMKTIGNVKANAYWNPDERKHPLPTNMEESERDSELEKYIRSKYEFKRFRPLSARAAEHLGESRSLASLQARPRTAPIRSSVSPSLVADRVPPLPERASQSTVPPASSGLSVPAAAPSQAARFQSVAAQPVARSVSWGSTPGLIPVPPNQQVSLTNSTFNDLISLQAPAANSSLPLQYQAPPAQPSSYPSFSMPSQSMSPHSNSLAGSPMATTPSASFSATNPYATLSASPNPLPSSFPGTPNTFRSASLPVANGQSQNAQVGLGMNPSGYNGGTFSTTPGVGGYSFGATNPYAQQHLQQPFAQSMSLPGSSPFMPSQSMSPIQGSPSPFAQMQNTGAPSSFPQMQGTGSPFAQTQQPSFGAQSPSLSQQAQQAQNLFRSMAGNNPFGS